MGASFHFFLFFPFVLFLYVLVTNGYRSSHCPASLSQCRAIDFDEFVQLMTRRMQDTDDDMRYAFQQFDTDQDGKVCAEELLEALLGLGETVTRQEVDEMIAEADCLDHDGFVSFEEFKKMMLCK
eukprot:TRINITY_DN7008_c0_g1_i2.p1 TRINITY_DN7008_c0_g1~~TRINITY_DN7008_c0_g1_i2.p1  ORF type:complete len:125 (-),score=22.14 TRINITY_DN7008_c0_g1_i2:22-396(-)